jgi:hypothetical protein
MCMNTIRPCRVELHLVKENTQKKKALWETRSRIETSLRDWTPMRWKYVHKVG